MDTQPPTTAESPPLNSPAWRVRAYRPGDEFELVKLFEKANGRSITPAYYRWKLCSLPSPVENIWLAGAGRRPSSRR